MEKFRVKLFVLKRGNTSARSDDNIYFTNTLNNIFKLALHLDSTAINNQIIY